MNSATFLRVLYDTPDKKGVELQSVIRQIRSGNEVEAARAFDVDTQGFLDIPATPFAYWAPESVRALYRELPHFEGTAGTARQGVTTSDDFRFIRARWEPAPVALGGSAHDSMAGSGWMTCSKGGDSTPFYAPVDLVLNWGRNGAEMKHFGRAAIRNESYQFLRGLTWSLRTRTFSPQVLPEGAITTTRGSGIFASGPELPVLLGWMCSSVVDALLKVALGRAEHPQFDMGDVSNLPWPTRLSGRASTELGVSAMRIHGLLRHADAQQEISPVFCLPTLVRVYGHGGLCDAYRHAEAEQSDVADTVRRLRHHVDASAALLYDMSIDDVEKLISLTPTRSAASDEDLSATDESSDDDESDTIALPGIVPATAGLVSWTVGVAFGRWDVRMATAPSLLPALPGAFERLPRVAPGGLVGPDALPATAESMASEAWLRARPNVITLPQPGSLTDQAAIPASQYPISVAWDGVLVDDEGHERDIVTAVRRVLAYVYGERADAIEQEALEILRGDGASPKTLRDWFRNAKAAALGKPFFDYHIGRYSKSRRKAPIYWRLAASPNAPYAVWLYYARLTKDTLWRVLGDYVTPRRTLGERQLAERRQARDTATGPARRRADQQVVDAQELLESVQTLEAELRRVAARGYSPDLDDGVVISAAPLHRMIPWKEPESVWKKFEKGDYDWAKLAMVLWPDRVRAKCETDKSLAIAHGLA